MSKNDKIGRKTTIAARIVRLSTCSGAIALIVLTCIFQYLIFSRMNDQIAAEVDTLTYSFASAVSNADIYSNDILDKLFVDFAKDNSYGAKGYIITKQGAVISACGDDDIIQRGDNISERGDAEPALIEFGELIRWLDTQWQDNNVALATFERHSGHKVIKIGGVSYIAGWARIRRYDTLNVFVLIPYENVVNPMMTTGIISAILCVAYIIASMLVAIFVSKKMTEPLAAASKRMGELARGDLMSPYPRTNRNDETLYLLKSLSLVIKAMRSYIEDITYVLSAIAVGDLSVTPQAEYKGDFIAIKDSLDSILDSFNETFAEVHRAALSVNECSEQVSDGSNELSKNVSDASAVITEISGSVSDINASISENAKKAMAARETTVSADRSAEEATKSMKQMVLGIRDIADRSARIEHIIGVIDDIAFQTNILALNAAVEAARAGDAGLGFAVVADEVRILAVKSSEAAAQTKELIESTLEAIKNGTEYAERANKALDNVTAMVNETLRVAREISDLTNEQAAQIDRISDNMGSISHTVSANSKTAEQNAAVTEELSGQFEILSEMINKFKLKK